jgi:hypothetical protein
MAGNGLIKSFGGTYHLSSTLKTEATCSSEALVDFQRSTRRYIPEDRTLRNHRCENLISYKGLIAPRTIAELEVCPFLFIRCCLFSMFRAPLDNWRRSPLFAIWGHAMLLTRAQKLWPATSLLVRSYAFQRTGLFACPPSCCSGLNIMKSYVHT